jgi:hypothetical protein
MSQNVLKMALEVVLQLLALEASMGGDANEGWMQGWAGTVCLCMSL